MKRLILVVFFLLIGCGGGGGGNGDIPPLPDQPLIPTLVCDKNELVIHYILYIGNDPWEVKPLEFELDDLPNGEHECSIREMEEGFVRDRIPFILYIFSGTGLRQWEIIYAEEHAKHVDEEQTIVMVKEDNHGH